MLGFGHTQSGGNPCNERGGSHFLSSSLSHLLSAMHRSADALMPKICNPSKCSVTRASCKDEIPLCNLPSENGLHACDGISARGRRFNLTIDGYKV